MLLRLSTLALCCAVILPGCEGGERPIRYPSSQPTAAPPPPPSTPAPAPAPAPTAAEAGRVTLGAAMLVGGNGMNDPALDRSTEDFKAVFAAGASAFRQCYAAAAQRVPGLSGELTVKIVIRPNGTIHEIKRLGGTLTDPGLIDCTLQALGRLPYRPHGGQLFAVETPIEFAP